MPRSVSDMLRGVAMAVAVACCAAVASAGDADFEGDDDHDDGPPFFGEVKDVAGLKPMDGVRVRAEVKDASFPIIVSSDAEGRFKFRGFGKDTPVDDVKITCGQDGYGVVDITRRKPSGAANAPVEIECLLERKK